MAERDFQAALLHLYRAGDRDEPAVAAVPAWLSLSARERAWLAELMTSQRDRLRFMSAHLRTKRQRFVRGALPRSRDAFAELFESLLQEWSRKSPLEDVVHGANTARNFAMYVGAQMHPDAPRALAFIRFDALCAAISLCPHKRDRLEELSSALRLALGEDADLLWCEYDLATMQNPVLLEKAEPLPAPQPILLFREQAGSVRSVIISSGLAAALHRFAGGACLSQVIEAETGTARNALSYSLAQLQRLGVPFFIRAHAKVPVPGAVIR